MGQHSGVTTATGVVCEGRKPYQQDLAPAGTSTKLRLLAVSISDASAKSSCKGTDCDSRNCPDHVPVNSLDTDEDNLH